VFHFLKLGLGGTALAALLSSTSGLAADLMPVKASPAALPPASWTGFYIGGHIGMARGESRVGDPFGTSIFGDDVATPGFLGGATVGYNWQMGAFVLGIEGDFSLADINGTNTCFAFSGTYVSSNCAAKTDWFATITGRVGHVIGAGGRTLVYGKGGVAFARDRLDVSVNNQFVGGGIPPATTHAGSATATGWTLGIGIEHALTPAWSVKAEYDYLDFGRFDAANPPSASVDTLGNITAITSTTTAGVDQTVHMMKLGLNYRWGADPNAAFMPAPVAMPRGTAALASQGWVFEFGARYWYSTGGFQKDIPGYPASSTSLVSRLTYDGVSGHSGEIFGRIDSPWGPFVKGLAGLGRTDGGRMNDEDWGIGPPPTAYSNTLSNLIDNDMKYATVDLGYNVLRGTIYKVGAFVGYNYYYERFQANDCNQISLPASGICAPAITGTPVITETDRWHALRVGANAEVAITDSVKLTADVAYLPYVKFSGVDNHWLRDLVIDESGHGRGVQAELIVSYQVTPQFSVGAGGRYWAAWTTRGSDWFNGVLVDRTDTYRMERYGTLLQAKYQFAPPPALAVKD
jgi:opacity protein-like surface antigen/outer membrane protease